MQPSDIPIHLRMELATFAGSNAIDFVFDLLIREIEARQCGMSLSVDAEKFKTAYTRLADKKELVKELRLLFDEIKQEFENEKV